MTIEKRLERSEQEHQDRKIERTQSIETTQLNIDLFNEKREKALSNFYKERSQEKQELEEKYKNFPKQLLAAEKVRLEEAKAQFEKLNANLEEELSEVKKNSRVLERYYPSMGNNL